MKRFLTNICLFVLFVSSLVLAAFAAIQALPPQFTDSCYAAMLDKYERLQSIDEPKLVLLGGSSLTFGMNSPALEEAIQMPVVNMGLYAAVKSGFYLNLVKPHIQSGDTIVLCFEYPLYKEAYSRPVEFMYALENYPAFWRAVPAYELPYLAADYFDQYAVKKVLKFLYPQPKTNTVTNDPYIRAAFNAWGDCNFPRPAPQPMRQTPKATFVFDATTIEPLIVRNFNQFYQYAQKKGAKVFLSFPPIEKSFILSNETEILEYQAAIEEQIDIPVISDITDYIFDTHLFYDTSYHLTDEGVTLRTAQFYKDLSQALDEE